MKQRTLSRNLKITLYIIVGMSVFIFARLALFIMYYDKFKTNSAGEILFAFINGIRFDASVFFTITAVFWALMLIPIRHQLYYKILGWLLLPIYILLACILGADVLYFGYVSRHMANELFSIGNDLGFAVDMIMAYWHLVIIWVVIFIVIAFLWSKLVRINTAPYKSWVTALVSVLFWVAFVNLGIRGNVDSKPISTIDAFITGDSNIGNLSLNGIFTSFKFYSNRDNTQGTNTQYVFYDNDTARSILGGYKAAECALPDELSALKKPNIVFILLESWSAYYVDSFSGNNFGITPEFDNISSRSMKFMRHYSPDKRSIASIQATLTGIPPMLGVPSLGFGLETMAIGNVGRILRDDGYDTIFVQTSKRRSFYMDSIAKSLGFSKYFGMEDAEIKLDYPDKKASKFGWDYESYMMLADELKKDTKKPFFAFIFTGTTHTPYAKLPEQFMKFPYEAESENGFKNTLYYADWSLGEFFKSIQDEPWYDNTIFIISADHTVGRYEKVEYPEDYRIPLIIYSPKLKSGTSTDNMTSHVDITPTILDIAGLTEKGGEYLGSSIFCKDENNFAVTSEWNSAGILTKNGYLRHSFGNILNFLPENMTEEEKQRLEKVLLSYYQIGFLNVSTAHEK